MALEDDVLQEVDAGAGAELSDEEPGDVEHAEEDGETPDAVHGQRAEVVTQRDVLLLNRLAAAAEDRIDGFEPGPGDGIAERLAHRLEAALADVVDDGPGGREGVGERRAGEFSVCWVTGLLGYWVAGFLSCCVPVHFH